MIRLDLDGVLANLEVSATKVHRDTGLGYVPKDFIPTTYSFWLEWGISSDKFWSVIDNTPNFWENIEPYPYLDELLAVIPNYRILSTPRPTAVCWSGKFKWVKKYLGKDYGTIKKIKQTNNLLNYVVKITGYNTI